MLDKLPHSKTLNRGVLFTTAGLLVVLAFANIVGFFNDGFTCGTVNTDEEKRAKTIETINRQMNAAYGIFGIVLAVYALNYAKNNEMKGTYIHMLSGVAVLILASWFSVFGQNMDFKGKVAGANAQTKCRHPIEGVPIAIAVVSILLVFPAGLAMVKQNQGM